MPEIWDGGTPSPTESLPASGGESELSAIGIGAYWFPTTDYRVDVGFLGSLPLSPPTKSKPVTPWDLNNRSSLAHSPRGSVDPRLPDVGFAAAEGARHRPYAVPGPLVVSKPNPTIPPGAGAPV